MTLDVSVVIPAFNPGANIDACLRSALGQTLDHDRYEVVVVDDGSTDGTAGWLDSAAACHPGRLVVRHIEASGWPGRPRNIGVDIARGRFVQFLDSDDELDPRALARLLALADESAADLVIGKLSSDFRGLNHHVFRRTVVGRTVHDYPLVDTLTPHKMFRRDFLITHGIRFAEGPRHVEDEHFCMQAYMHATSVAVVGDLACYFYRRRRTGGRNLGDTPIVPREYFRDLSAVLDVIEAGVPDPERRRPLLRRFYRTEVLGRLRGNQMLKYDERHRAELAAAAREVAQARFEPAVRASLPSLLRIQGALLLDGDVAGLVGFAERLEALRLVAAAGQPRWRGGRLQVTVTGSVELDGVPLRLAPDGDGGWLLPSALAGAAGIADRRFGDEDLADVDCALISRADAQLWSTTDGLTMQVTDDGRIAVSGEVALDPWTVRGGEPLAPGLWDVRLRVSVSGLTRVSRLIPRGDEPSATVTWLGDVDGVARAVTAYWTAPQPALALDVDEWMHPLHEIIVASAPTITQRRRRVTITTEAVSGDAGHRPAQLVLPTALGLARCPGRLETTTAGARLRLRVPRHAGRVDPRAGWLQVGDTGGAPGVPLPDAAAED